jgi:DNA-binding transcriptional LysR family regulator
MLPILGAMISRLHLRQFRLLIALGDLGSLVKAADRVGLTQPGASKALHEIEAALGVTLFVRTSRGLVANDVGHCVIRYARLIESDLNHLRQEVIGILQGHGGRLSVGVIMGAVPLLTENLSRVLKVQPDLSVEIVEDTSAALLRLLDQGRLDAAICRTSVSQRPHLYDSVNVRDETLAVVARIDHPASKRKTVKLTDLADFRWVVYSANMPMRLLLEREFQQAGLRFPLYIVETTSAFATLSLLQTDPSFVALLSSDVAKFCTNFHMTSILPLQLASQSEPYELVTRLGSPLSPAIRLLIKEFGVTESS